jgi:ankyrin repeat protein
MVDPARILLEHGAEINQRGGYYGTALQAAAYRGVVEVVEFLIEKGADVNIPGGYYGTALQAACGTYHGKTEIVQLLIAKGANVNAQVRAQGGGRPNALQAALFRGHLPIVMLLLEHGAWFNAPNGEFTMTLREAAQKGKEELGKLMVDRGFKIYEVVFPSWWTK